MPTLVSDTKPKAIKFVCPHCEGTVRVPHAYAGRKGRCPKCKGALRVPGERKSGSDEGATSKPAQKKPQPARQREEPREEPAGKARKECSACGESIVATAKKCRHCGTWFDERARGRARGGSAEAEVHVVLKVWGILIMAIYSVSTLLGVALTGLSAVNGASMGIGLGLALTGVSFIVVRIGWGLFKGQKAAVIGLAVIACLALLGSMASLATGSPAGIIRLVVAGALFGPPLAVGFQNMSRLK